MAVPLNQATDPGGQVAAADGRTEVPSVLRKLEKWGDYPAMGLPVWPSRFIPMKTPLSAAILSEWDEESPCRNPHTVASVLEHCKASHWRLGMILNLASHESLYDCDLPHNSGLETRHVELTSKMLPSPQAMAEVIHAVRDFWHRRPDDYVAIHCAYGFNRTGFTVCCYLIQELGLSVDAALQSFALSRPPGIKHEKFVTELHNRFYNVRPAIPVFDAALHAPFYSCSSSDGQVQLECVRMAHRQAAGSSSALDQMINGRGWLPQNQHITPNLSHCDLVAHITGDENELEPSPQQAAHNQEVNNDSIGRADAAKLLKALEKHRASMRSSHSPDRGSAISPSSVGDRDCFDAAQSSQDAHHQATRAQARNDLRIATQSSATECGGQGYSFGRVPRHATSVETMQTGSARSECDTPAMRNSLEAASLDPYAGIGAPQRGAMLITSHALAEQGDYTDFTDGSGSDTALSTSLTPRRARAQQAVAPLGCATCGGGDAHVECTCRGMCARCRGPDDSNAAGMYTFAVTSGHSRHPGAVDSTNTCASTAAVSQHGDSPRSSSVALTPALPHECPLSAMSCDRAGAGTRPTLDASATASQQTQISAGMLPRAGSDLSMELGNSAQNCLSKPPVYQ